MNKDNDQWLDKVIREGGVNRRRFLAKTGKLGLAAMGSGMLANTLSTAALADTSSFDWKKHKGKTIKLLLNKHPYANAMIAYLDNFKKLTGINVKYDIFPKDVYFQKVTAALASSSPQYDLFMTGVYQIWEYGPANYLVDLKPYLSDASKTADSYQWHDIFSSIRNGLAWSGKPGEPVGTGHQWAVPLAFEVYSLSYNQDYLKKAGASVPQNLPDLIDKCQHIQKKMSDVFGVATRGTRSWATIQPGYLSGLVNYGGIDFKMENGKLKSAVNSAACKKFTKLWIEMEQKAGPKDWTSYDWYKAGQALGAVKAAILYDADINGFFQETDTKEAGHIAYAPFVPNPKASHPTSNVWIWALAMSNFSHNKEAAWYFLQWASGPKENTFGAVHKKQVDPTRKAVFNDAAFQQRLEKHYPGYKNQYLKTVPHAKIRFTPQPLFFNVTTQWAAALQKMYNNKISVDEGLDQLADRIDHQMQSAGIS